VLACLAGQVDNLIEPASALAALDLTLDVHQRLTRANGLAGTPTVAGATGPHDVAASSALASDDIR
jgi:hypothetical protein